MSTYGDCFKFSHLFSDSANYVVLNKIATLYWAKKYNIFKMNKSVHLKIALLKIKNKQFEIVYKFRNL